MRNIHRVKTYFSLLSPFAKLWQQYITDKSADNYIDFWQWAYRHSDSIKNYLEAAHEELFKDGKLTYLIPKEIDTHRYEPVIEGDWGLFALPLERCGFCRKQMLSPMKGFHLSSTMNQEAQMRAAGLVYRGDSNVTSFDVCEECVAAGKVAFNCIFCGEYRKSDLYHDSEYGEPICKICYESLTAKEWDEKMEALHEAHRYDY